MVVAVGLLVTRGSGGMCPLSSIPPVPAAWGEGGALAPWRDPCRHARAWPGHPRNALADTVVPSWMAGTSPAMTNRPLSIRSATGLPVPAGVPMVTPGVPMVTPGAGPEH